MVEQGRVKGRGDGSTREGVREMKWWKEGGWEGGEMVE